MKASLIYEEPYNPWNFVRDIDGPIADHFNLMRLFSVVHRKRRSFTRCFQNTDVNSKASLGPVRAIVCQNDL